MNKTILGLFLVVNLYSQSYEVLLEEAIKNNVDLQLIQTQQKRIFLEGEIERRYENPNLELEVADFSNHFITQKNEFGAKIGVSQTIPLPHIQNDKKHLIEKKLDVAQKEYDLARVNFIYRFNLKYLAYKKAQHFLDLQHQTLVISKEILEVVEKRFQEGAIAKSEYLEAKLDLEQMQSRLKEIAFKATEAKSTLVSFAQIENSAFIDSEHLFFLQDNYGLNPIIKLNESRNQLSQAKIELLQHSVDSIELFSEFEREPEQNIFRIGVSMALPTFNLNSEEKQLEKINISNQKLLSANQEKRRIVQIKQLQNEQSKLESLKENYKKILLSQKQLFNMYKLSYTIAKVNLLKLQQVKQQRITTQEKLLETNFAIEQNIIKINYLQGADHE